MRVYNKKEVLERSDAKAVKIKKHYFAPTNLLGIGAKWALDFSKASILNVIN